MLRLFPTFYTSLGKYRVLYLKTKNAKDTHWQTEQSDNGEKALTRSRGHHLAISPLLDGPEDTLSSNPSCRSSHNTKVCGKYAMLKEVVIAAAAQLLLADSGKSRILLLLLRLLLLLIILISSPFTWFPLEASPSKWLNNIDDTGNRNAAIKSPKSNWFCWATHNRKAN